MKKAIVMLLVVFGVCALMTSIAAATPGGGIEPAVSVYRVR